MSFLMSSHLELTPGLSYYLHLTKALYKKHLRRSTCFREMVIVIKSLYEILIFIITSEINEVKYFINRSDSIVVWFIL